MKKIAIISFTRDGSHLAEKIHQAAGEEPFEINIYQKSRYAEEVSGAMIVKESLQQWTKEQWGQVDALLFIGATGIAVRAIAPCICDKQTDPAVLCMDEQGHFCISLLSGHLGGANELTSKIANLTGAVAVITTATDLNQCFAVDLFGKENHLTLKDKKLAKDISARLLARKKIVTVGLGCRKGVEKQQIEDAVNMVCKENQIPPECVKQIASIDLKKEENGILEYSKERNLPFITYTADELKAVPGTYTDSLFVEQVTGVDNVCERSAVLGSGFGILIQKKKAMNQVTCALDIENEEQCNE